MKKKKNIKLNLLTKRNNFSDKTKKNLKQQFYKKKWIKKLYQS